MRFLALALLLASCRMPDSVGVGANASQFDYLGFNQNTLLTNDTGMGYGVGVWAEWVLNRPVQPITWEWPDRPPYYLTGDKPPVIVTPGSTEPRDAPDRVDQGITAVKALDDTGASTQIIVLVLGLAVVGAIIILRSRKPK